MNKDFVELVNIRDVDFRCSYFALDLETSGLVPQDERILMVQIANDNGAWAIDAREQTKADWDILADKVEDESILKIGHNLKFDGNFLKTHHGMQIKSIYDTMVGEKLLVGGGKAAVNLASTAKRHLGIELDKGEQTSFVGMTTEPFTYDQVVYGIEDVSHLKRLMEVQKKAVKKSGMGMLLNLENKVTEVLIHMESRGVAFNKDPWLKLAAEAEEKAKKLQQELDLATDYDVENWNSAIQVKRYFAGKGIIIDSLTDLPKMKDKPEAIVKLLEYKKWAKRASAFGKKYMTTKVTNRSPIVYTDTVKNGRIHASYNQMVNTGRFSCSKPNLQQVPSDGYKDENGNYVTPYRECFVSAQGFKMAVGDFTAQELAVIAVGSKEEAWLKVLREKGDLHSVAAALLFGDRWKNMSDSEKKVARGKAKGMNFGNAYGLSYKSFAEAQGIPSIEGKQIFNDYARAFPNLTSWLKGNGLKAVICSETRTFAPFNRYRDLRGLEDWRKKNIGKNAPIQGASADITKYAMVKIWHQIKSRGWEGDAYIVMQVHDEVVCEVKDFLVDEFAVVMRDCMESAAEFVLGERLIEAPIDIADYWIKG